MPFSVPGRGLLTVAATTLCLLCACGAAPTGIAQSPPAPTQPASLSGPGVVRYAALGASETYGVGATPTSSGYAYLVRDALHATSFVNTGIPAATLNAAFQTELTGALSIHPTVATVFFGVNDVRDGVRRDVFMSALRDLLDTLRRSGAKVLVIGLPDLTVIPAVAAQHLADPMGITISWNAGIQDAARATGASYLSLRDFTAEVVAHPQYLASDGLHPSTSGHDRLARIVAAALRVDATPSAL